MNINIANLKNIAMQLMSYSYDALKIMITLVFILILIDIVVYRIVLKNKKSMNHFKGFIGVILIGYTFVVLCVTYFSRDDLGYGMRGINLSLFWSYKYAWQTAIVENWEQIIFNIIMFMPLGFLLPLFRDEFKKMRITTIVSFLCSLCIEISQLITGRGLFELDDMMNNTIGGILGYCIIMILLNLINKCKSSRIMVLIYFLFPSLIVGSFYGIYHEYSIQEMGNIPIEYAVKVNTSQMYIYTNLLLDDKNKTVPIYIFKYKNDVDYAKAKTKEIFANLGFTGEIIYKINKNILECNLSNASISYNLINGTWHFQNLNKMSYNGISYTEEEMHNLLRVKNLYPDCELQIIGNENGIVTFESKDNLTDGNREAIIGQLTFRLSDDNDILSINSQIVEASIYKYVEIASEQEVYKRLLDGKFMTYDVLNKNDMLEIIGCNLGYYKDTKNFYRPIYIFKYILNGNEVKSISIPARKTKYF